jgi:ferredoxin--NADP+ reductase
VELLLEDARAGLLARSDPLATAETVDELLASRGVEQVIYAGWEAIDAEERGRGEPQGRPRIKLCSWEELRAAARRVAAGR